MGEKKKPYPQLGQPLILALYLLRDTSFFFFDSY